ncbi:histidine kinase [Aequorivita sp. SDUM287046]|uniref:Histidine kinase n=1 Tax=Aequorivita aurantiaca TaxID=3053356 RepID=A0ABT8DHU1_9FLAO|nr:histidine kinase [Aequorivita aurantiaca]MDN3724893.1 histidine kinase [Aequorivita aurantiaca]
MFTNTFGKESFDPTSLFYLISALVFIIGTWTVNDWLVYRQVKSGKSINFSSGVRLLLVNFIIVLPVCTIVYYLSNYVFAEAIFLQKHENPAFNFRIDVLRAAIIALSIIVFNLFYHSMQQKKDMERTMDRLQKELVTSKYQLLKNQISPHFLFNSFNTLTGLMYEDRDLASDFVTRLALSYRYILDNGEEDMVPLKKELDFLDAFIFMMNVRHEGAIDIKIKILVDPNMFMIPTLSLQMLVENALKHNYFSKEKPLSIRIETVASMSIVVINNLRKRDTAEASTKLGIANIKKRYSFYTDQEVTTGTTKGFFTVTMPLLTKNAFETSVLSLS